jgi:hypothetical protein
MQNKAPLVIIPQDSLFINYLDFGGHNGNGELKKRYGLEGSVMGLPGQCKLRKSPK